MKRLSMVFLVVAVALSGVVYGQVTDTRAEWSNGYLVYRNVITNETVDVLAPVKLWDDFTGKEVDATNDWTVAGVNSGTAAVAAAIGGKIRITCGNADNDDVDVASLLTWEASKSCGMEARIAITDATTASLCVGFSDATGEAADLLPLGYATTTLTSTASDCAMFVYDPDATTDIIRAVAVKANVDGTVFSGTAPVSGAYNVYRVEIDAAGNVDFWLDGAHIGRQALGITTTTDLCVYVGLINHSGVSSTADVDYIRAWQKR